MSHALKFYYDFMSQPSRALWIALRLAKVPYEDCPIALRKGEQLNDKFRKINRFQKVPCITDGDLQLSESVAIIRYLDAKQLWPESLYPKNVISRAHVDEFLEWQHTLRFFCCNFFLQLWLYPLTGRGHMPSEQQITKLCNEMETQLNVVENTWLKNTPFVTGQEMSIADLFGACEVEQTKLAKYVLEDKYPKISEWLANVRKAANPHYDEAHTFINKAVNKQNATK